LADTFETAELIEAGDFLVESAGLVAIDKVDQIVFRDLEVLRCPFSIVNIRATWHRIVCFLFI